MNNSMTMLIVQRLFDVILAAITNFQGFLIAAIVDNFYINESSLRMDAKLQRI